MKSRLLVVISALLVVSFLIPGCAPKAKVFKVGYINADLENPAWNAVGTGFTDKAKELGMDGIAVSSSGQAAPD